MGWGLSSIQEIVFHLFQRGIEFRLCRRGPLRPQPRPPLFQTGLGWRPAGYRPTLTDYLAYEERRDEFLRSPRGRAARFAGGIVGRLAVDLAMVLTDDEIAARGPSDESFEHSVCLWDGQSSTAYWDDALTPDEINLICGVYVVNTDDGWQKKAISWWPTPTSFFFSGLNIGWWSPDCERWYQKRLLDFKNHSAQLFTQAEWKHNMRFIQKSRIVAKANERLAAEYLHRKLAE
ncbi:hypothetical protein B0H14DRAFT_2529928 [Mycena olivaceomarginata]|nr:hypothetical protein B0H14DRAFT_2529928 [Mycena olivaceomarginata]